MDFFINQFKSVRLIGYVFGTASQNKYQAIHCIQEVPGCNAADSASYVKRFSPAQSANMI